MNNDKELLELAAKAAGYAINFERKADYGTCIYYRYDGRWWNPIDDDGDRYRLMKVLGIAVNFEYKCAYFGGICIEWPSNAKDDAYAVVMVAAEIGGSIK